MGLAKDFIQGGVGLLGKAAMGVADHYTGGLASKFVNKGLDAVNRNSGLIGKVAGNIGRSVLSDSTRNKMANAANKAIEYLPSGKVKDTLKSLNESTQNGGSNIPTTSQPRRKRKFRKV